MTVCEVGLVPIKIYRIKLSESERNELESMRDKKRGKATNNMRALAILLSDQGSYGPALKDVEIHEITGPPREPLNVCENAVVE
jgi:hypothetical protein